MIAPGVHLESRMGEPVRSPKIRSVNKEFYETVGNGSPTGQCSKGDNCSFRHDLMKRAKTTAESFSEIFDAVECEICIENQKSWRQKPKWENWLDCRARIISQVRTNSFSEKWHPPECLFYKSENGCRFGDECCYAHRQVDEQPGKRCEKRW